MVSCCMLNTDKELVGSLKKTISHLKKQIFIEELKRRPLVFSFENSKLKDTYTFSLPSGFTCPGAKDCLSKADRHTGKITDGPHCQFRCFSATAESAYTAVRLIRWHNFDRLKEAAELGLLADLILESLPEDAKLVRIHVAGDFYNQAYFNAWLEVARQRPEVIFYAYTKSAPFWSASREVIPSNFKLTASLGGHYDNVVAEQSFKSAQVVFNVEDAEVMGLEIDKDDTHAWKQDKSFALLVHGTQPAGSEAGKSWSAQLKELKKTKVKKPKKTPRVPNVFKLVQQVLKLSLRLARLLKTPEWKVESVGVPQTV